VQAKDLVATTVEQYVGLVSKLGGQWMPPQIEVLGPWFRGHSNSEWSLVPKLYRQEDHDRNTEDEIREEFITRAPSLTEAHPSNEWQWYFLMQHYGAPTRLLDWTDGGLIGLYFAVRDNRGCSDAAVWMLDPWWLNGKVVGKQEVVCPDALGVLRGDRQRVKKWLPTRFHKGTRLPLRPLAIYPSHTMRRISTQRSCFTIHGTDLNAMHEISREKKSRLIKIIIPSFQTATIRRELEMCGIDEATVFPDLEGLARALGAKWQSEQAIPPHAGVYARLGRSKHHGVGVLAIRRIPKGTKLFEGDFAEMVWVELSRLPKRPAAIKDLYRDFGVFRNDRVGVPIHFNRMTISWYLNESKSPNVRCDENYEFFASEDIGIGEELTVDYSTYSESPDTF
jgi:hypothetical protein